MFTRLLVPYDGSPAARSALAQAIALGGRVPAGIILAHINVAAPREVPVVMGAVTRPMREPVPIPDEQPIPDPELEEAADQVRRAGLEVTTLYRAGNPTRELYELASEADAVLLGRAEPEIDGDLLGPVTRGLVRSLPAPVLVCGLSPSPADRCAVLYDGSAGSTRVLAFAARYAGVTGARVEVLYAGEDDAAGRELLARAAAALSEQPLRFETHQERNGSPTGILAAIQRFRCNLVLTGAVRSEGRNFVTTHAAAVLRATDLPVLIHP